MDMINNVGAAMASLTNGTGLFILGEVVATVAIAPLVAYALNGWRREARDQLQTMRHLSAALDHIIELQPLAEIGRKRPAQWRANNAKRSAK